MRKALLASLCLLAIVGGGAAAAPRIVNENVTVAAEPILNFGIGRAEQVRFGKLDYLGGIELLAGNRHVGGLSGLVVSPDGGSLLAVTDNGLWFRAELEQDAAARPLAIRNASIAPMVGPDGKPLLSGGLADTEAVTRNEKGEVFVSVEGRHSILAFPAPFDLNERARPIALPQGISKLRYNKGLEALAASPSSGPLKGALVAIAERGQSYDDDMPGFLVGGARPGQFTVRRSGDFDATDAAFLPDGDLLLLERRFNLRHGIGMRIRRIAAASLMPGAVVDGDVLIEAGFTHQIDNMEGLAVHRLPAGDVILTVISDDNRSILQRTLLLRFRLAE
ncbi:esterase-like activity of phytase family protein [Stappia sp. F7233]|uniref:Esterase-like activity of phytase family protein n=1 Tax=Stappia albiluteola TaxID=2758565 RepID=A0A839AIT9_9HYPH|nr:esterase-like activity of phytase family protein [Stappia albiluteola]MBA5778976.1 esterase-like activity of phytase family protein [Stappia albiluteola]